MKKNVLEMIELRVYLQTRLEAKRLNINYRVRAYEVDGKLEVLVKLKEGLANNKAFVDYIGDFVLDTYQCTVRFSYLECLEYKADMLVC